MAKVWMKDSTILFHEAIWRAMMPYKRGDVILVLYPNTDLRTAKKRPALIIQSDDIDTGLAL